MTVKPSITKTAVKLLCLFLFATLMMASVCFADDDEDDFLPKKAYSLGSERPKPQPKPKVIIKERIVVQCPPGSNWNADVKRCQNEEGEDIAPAPKAKKKQQPRVAEEEREPAPQQQAKASQAPDDKYIYPRTKMRVRPGQCIMTGENIVCDFKYINTSDQTYVGTDLKSSSMVDNFGNTFKVNKAWGCGTYLAPGGSCEEHLQFNFVDVKADSLTLIFIISAKKTTDFVKFTNFPITK